MEPDPNLEHFDTQLTQFDQDPAHFGAWWEETVCKVTKEDRKRFNGLVIYICWNLWKERNWRIFSNAQESALQVASRIKEDIAQRKRALERED
jgi:hypothetical protein